MKRMILQMAFGMLLSAMVAISGEAQAEKSVISNVLIILDSSGSMAKKTKDGKQKLASAKIAMNELVDSLSDGLKTGFIVYGHRHKARCDDIELVFEPRPLTEGLRNVIKYDIKKLKPLGVTPIAASLTLAGETLRNEEGENSIILISDGKETCEGDPVKVAKELEERYGIKVYVDVIGFDVTDKERRELEAIATAGGGRYYNADTADQLKLVTKKAVQERRVVIPPAPKVVVPPPVEEKPEPEAEYLKRGEIERGGKAIRGGKYYDDAVEIGPGEYKLDHKLRQNEFDYFKINVKNGQRIVCSVRTTDLSGYGGVQIHAEDRTRLHGTEAIGKNLLREVFYEIYDAPSEAIQIYIVIGSVYSNVEDDVIYAVKLIDHFDAESGTDAGNYFDTAIKTKAGTYENNWACFKDVDIFGMDLAAGEEMTVKIIPDRCKRPFGLELLNEDRERLLSVSGQEDGTVVKGAIKNSDTNQVIFVKVHRDVWDDDANGKYSMKIGIIKE